jgi:hypothetical protein
MIYGEFNTLLLHNGRNVDFRELPEWIADVFLEAVVNFAINNTILGVVMLVLSFTAVAAFDNAAKRQVR